MVLCVRQASYQLLCLVFVIMRPVFLDGQDHSVSIKNREQQNQILFIALSQ